MMSERLFNAFSLLLVAALWVIDRVRRIDGQMVGWAMIGLALTAILVLSGCGGARYHQPDRDPVEVVTPHELPEPPDAEHLVCPRGHWDPQANCPWGAEYAAYNDETVERLMAYRVIARSNTEIATANAEVARELDAEATAANETAARLEAELEAVDRWRFIERLGWIGALAGAVLLGL